MYEDLYAVELPDDVFFHDSEHPKTQTEYDTFVERLEYAEAAAAFSGVSEMLSVHPVARWHGSELSWLGAPDMSQRRAVPPLMSNDIFTRDDAAIDIILTYPLQTGERKWSQVWRAELSTSGLAAPVVVKIFQQSMFRRPGSFAETGIERRYWPTGAQQARAEAWAYRTLAQLQGKTIPWSYGFFKLTLSNGENAFAHVMEYINRPSGVEISLSDASNDQCWQFADSMALSYYEILRRGVQQVDGALQNMLIDRADTYPVVFVDFAVAKPTENLLTDSDAEFIVYALLDMEFQGARLAKWFKDRKASGLPWMRMFELAETEAPEWMELVERCY